MKRYAELGLLVALLAHSTAWAQGVIPGFPEEGGVSSSPSPGQVMLPNPTQGGASAGMGSYYKLPNGDLIGPDGTVVPANSFAQPGVAGQQGNPKTVITNPNGNERLSPAAGFGSQQQGGNPGIEAKIASQFNMQPEVVYNPDGTVTIKALPDMQDPFAAATEAMVPLTQEQVRMIKRTYQQNRKSMAQPFHGEMPAPVTSQVVLDLSPKAPPPIVRVIPGNGSTVSFRDISGAAWPILAFQSFNGRDFVVDQPIKGSNMISISALNNYAVGNVSVVLQNYSSPVILSMMSTAAKEMDSKVDIQVPLLGPNASKSGIPTMKPSDSDLLQVLYGVLPEGAKQLDVSGAQAKAWKTIQGDILVTGALQMVSPRPIQRESTGDGYYAYRMSMRSVYLVTQNGTERKLLIRERQ
ncbi:hypothetical protein CL689_05970 [Candidatus Saccharibacteria bacterium]|nr:hypothetical protein [Candidatus Saccharibacteria bacterium]